MTLCVLVGHHYGDTALGAIIGAAVGGTAGVVIGNEMDKRAAEMGFVDEPRLREEYQSFVDGRSDDMSFWYSMTLEDWLRRYF